MTPISVLITDDSALMRNLIGRIIENADGLMVAGKAMNGRFALEKIPRLKPDVILLDIEMPEMNGLEFLRERKKRGITVPVVILSSLARRGAEVTMEALALGASDFIMKPSGSISQDIHVVGRQIVETVLAYGQRYRQKTNNLPVLPRQEEPATSSVLRVIEREKTAAVPPVLTPAKERDFPPAVPHSLRQQTDRIEIVLIGISTGGPNALRTLFPSIDSALKVPIVIVQHMPPGFTAEFARSLGRITTLHVKEASDGDRLLPGHVYVAPGHSHVKLSRSRSSASILLSNDEPVNGHRPSVDVLFSSAAREYGKHCLAMIMTGMGRDGARHIGTLYNMGALTIGQDEQSSVVYGMPKVAREHGYIQYQLALDAIPGKINELVDSYGVALSP